MKPKDSWTSVYRQNYAARAFWDIHWIDRAKDLLESAKLLEPEVNRLWDSVQAHFNDKSTPVVTDHYQGTYFMLLAYAVENLLKAALVRKNSVGYRDNFRKTGKFPEELKSHNLVDLAKNAELAFNPEEEDLLRRLTRSAVWYGRYPVPLRYAAERGAEKFADGREYSVSWFGSDDVKNLNQLIDQMRVRLDLQGR